jgi:hypothetical protein
MHRRAERAPIGVPLNSYGVPREVRESSEHCNISDMCHLMGMTEAGRKTVPNRGRHERGKHTPYNIEQM